MLRKPVTRIVAAIVSMLVASTLSLAALAADFDAANATYEFDGATFTLSNGEVAIKAPNGMPIGYTLAKSASADGKAYAALYRNFGANLIWDLLFAFEEKDGTFSQIASVAAYEDRSSIESLAIEGGTVSLDLLVVSEADKELIRAAQTPTAPLTLKFTVENGAFVAAQ